jgi:SAM-dependent methyltransferase
MTQPVKSDSDFYSVAYDRLGQELTAKLRREVFAEDIGQVGWRTADEQVEYAGILRADVDTHVLDVACGAGGPSLALIDRTGCRLTGVDLEAAAIARARIQAAKRGLAERTNFAALDCNAPLPFGNGSFDALLCIDAILHFRNRFETLSEWARLLRRGGRLVFSDPAVLTGAVAKSELDIRTATGFCLLVPPGFNEEAIAAAGLTLLQCENRSNGVAEVAGRWHAARARHTTELEQQEGADGFVQRQRFFATVADLAASRRLSRFLYVAEKPAAP